MEAVRGRFSKVGGARRLIPGGLKASSCGINILRYQPPSPAASLEIKGRTALHINLWELYASPVRPMNIAQI